MSGKTRTSFFEELRRRNVIRVVAAYLVAAWVLIQIADTVFPYFGLAASTVTFLIIALAVGFIPVLVIAWVFELTPKGLVRDEKVEREDSNKGRPALRTIDYMTVTVLTVIVAVYAYEKFGQPSAGEAAFSSSPSIAVLPFENRSADPADIYFVDGIHDDILTSLANIASLRVISRTSVERFRDTDKSMKEIGAELNVVAILEGGVQRAGDTIRVNVQLIDVATDSHLWADTFDRQLTAENVFAIQSEIATTIAEELRATLSPEEETRLARLPTESLEAYEAYLLGKQRIQRRSGASLERAVNHFEDAIRLDPDFALAYVGLADSYMLMGSSLYGNRSRDEMLQPAMAAVSKAIEIDPNNGEAHATLAMIHNDFRTDVDPEPLFRRAIDMNPNYAPARQFYAEFLNRQDRKDEAMTQMQFALRLDPLSPIINVLLAGYYSARGQPNDARARILRAIEIDPQFARGYGELSFNYRDTGDWAHALTAAQEAYRLNPANVMHRAMQAEFQLQMGDLDAASRIVDEVSALAPEIPWTRFVTAMLHLVRNDAEAFQYALDNWDDVGRRGFYVPILVNGYLRAGSAEKALELVRSFDGRYSPPSEPDVAEMRNRGNANPEIAYSLALQAAGRHEEAAEWIQALLEYHGIDYRPKFGGTNVTQDDLMYLVEEARVHALNKDKDSALTAMRRAVDAGWSRGWIWYFNQDPSLELIRNEPEFQAMQEEVRARMAAQLEAYRTGKITVP